jgi:hypothetical protein
MSSATLRYIGADVARSQRWVAPFLFGASVIILFNAQSNRLLATYSNTAAALLPIAIWATYVVITAEDPVQASITAVIVGGPGRLRAAKIAASVLSFLGYAVVATAAPLVLRNHPDAATTGKIVAGLFATVNVGIFGAAVGALISPPIIRRRGWSVLVATVVILLDTAVPHAPPTRAMLALFDADHTRRLASTLLGITIETLALSFIVFFVATRPRLARV